MDKVFEYQHEDDEHNNLQVSGNDVTVWFTAQDWGLDNSTMVGLRRRDVEKLHGLLTQWLGKDN